MSLDEMNKLVATRLVLISEAFRTKRKNLNYSQQYMALHLGMSQNAYSKLEIGYTRMSVFHLFEIADLLDIDLSPYMLIYD